MKQEDHTATAKYVLQHIGQIFRYAVLTGRAKHNVAADLQGALPSVQTKHHASITDKARVGDLLRRLDEYEGYFPQKCVLRLAPLLFTRPNELLSAEWKDVDLEAQEWRIPAERMKMRRTHIVPLSNQAVAILKELEPITGQGRYLFPASSDPDKHLRDNRILFALKKGSTSKTGAKDFWGGHSDEVFTSLSAEDADTQAVVFKIPKAVRSTLDEFHFSVKAFCDSVVLREAEHPGYLFLPRVQRTAQ